MWIEYNANPIGKRAGDCTVRAVSKAVNEPWEKAYAGLCIQGLQMCDMPSNNGVVGAYLKSKGFQRGILPNNCPECYTIVQFCKDHPHGVFVVFVGGHVLCIENGDYFDSWDSGNENPIYFFEKGEN